MQCKALRGEQKGKQVNGKIALDSFCFSVTVMILLKEESDPPLQTGFGFEPRTRQVDSTRDM